MDTSKLTDRLRGIVKPPGRSVAGLGAGLTVPGPAAAHALEDVLGGEWREEAGHRAFVVERRLDAGARHGRVAIGDLAGVHHRSAAHAPTLGAGAPARPPFVFFDLETTGLSGGAGTHAFLVGCGWFTEDGAFVTRQYLMTAFEDERPMLESVTREIARAGTLVSFNGKSFDAPVLETRYLFHRLAWCGARLPHIDVLHPARRFWRDDRPVVDDGSSCSLTALEGQVLGVRRVGDVPGFEIPARYFQFIRSGDGRPLAAVLEHNRLDLISLAGLHARLLHLIGDGPATARDAREALALGRVYTRSGLDARANEAFEHVLLMHCSTTIRIESLRFLACAARRSRRYEEAAARWRQVLEVPGCPPHVAREATEALAIYHEHRVRDLAAARSFALRSLEGAAQPAWNDAVRHRLARIERKIERAEEPGRLAY